MSDTVVDWEEFLPINNYPLNADWTYAPRAMLAVSQPEVGPPIVRLRSRSTLDVLSCSITLPHSEFKSRFVDFVNNTLHGGVDWFMFPNPITGTRMRGRLVPNNGTLYNYKRAGDAFLGTVSFSVQFLNIEAVGV